MKASDISRVAEIRVFGWRCAYRGIVSDEHLFNELSVTGRAEKLAEQFSKNDNTSYEQDRYVYDDGIIRAFLMVGSCGDQDKPHAFELGALYVDPCLQGKGIGTALAMYCETIAITRGYNEICIWTFEKNAAARAFYEKLGYVHDGTTQNIEPYNATGVRYCKNI